MGLIEHAAKLIEERDKYLQENEDKNNKEFVLTLEKKECICGRTDGEPHFCMGPEHKKHFSIEAINEEDLPIGNYQIGIKI